MQNDTKPRNRALAENGSTTYDLCDIVAELYSAPRSFNIKLPLKQKNSNVSIDRLTTPNFRSSSTGHDRSLKHQKRCRSPIAIFMFPLRHLALSNQLLSFPASQLPGSSFIFSYLLPGEYTISDVRLLERHPSRMKQRSLGTRLRIRLRRKSILRTASSNGPRSLLTLCTASDISQPGGAPSSSQANNL